MTHQCSQCAVNAAKLTETLAHTNRLRKFIQAELELTIDIIEAGMTANAAIESIRDALRILSKLPRN